MRPRTLRVPTIDAEAGAKVGVNGVGGMVDLAVHLGSLTKALKDHSEEMKRNRELNIRRSTTDKGQVVLDGNGFGVIVVDTAPGAGWVMDVREFSICNGLGATQTLTGKAFVYNGPWSGINNLAHADIAGNWVDVATALPLAAFYDRGQMSIHYPGQFYIVITGGTSGVQVSLRVGFEYYRQQEAVTYS